MNNLVSGAVAGTDAGGARELPSMALSPWSPERVKQLMLAECRGTRAGDARDTTSIQGPRELGPVLSGEQVAARLSQLRTDPAAAGGSGRPARCS